MKPAPGTVVWTDITVPEARHLRDFYANVVGWNHEEVRMGDYADYNMIPPGDDEPAAGVCHARGPNAAIPPFWMIYVQVEDLTRSIDACQSGGGTVIDGPRSMGQNRLCLIRDPAGAYLGLVE